MTFRDTVLSLLRWFFGAGPTAGTGQVDHAVESSWGMPAWIVLLFFALAGCFILASYLSEHGRYSHRRRLVLAALRVTLVALVLFMLYGFSVRPYRVDKPDLIVLVDDSKSMTTADGWGGNAAPEPPAAGAATRPATRFDAARTLLLGRETELLEKLSSRYKVRLQLLSQSRPSDRVAAKLATSPASPSTPLGTRIKEILRTQSGRPTAAIVVLSDGIVTEGLSLQAVAHDAQRESIPLSFVGIGSSAPPRDLAIRELLVDDVVYVNDVIGFRFLVAASGMSGQEAIVRLRMADADEILAETSVSIDEEIARLPVSFRYRPTREGEFDFVVEIEVAPGEKNQQNNRRLKRVHVRNEKIRVLCVQAYPNYEFRYLKSLLGREYVDAKGERENPIELHTLLQEADLGYAETDRTALKVFPVAKQDLFAYDVLILGDVNPEFLSMSAVENIVDFVKNRGGGVVFIAGPRYMPWAWRGTPLAALLPIRLETAVPPPLAEPLTNPVRVNASRLGLSAPHMQLTQKSTDNRHAWENLPPLFWVISCPETKLGTRILAERTEQIGAAARLPIIALQYVGAGKVLFHATDETWRWRTSQEADDFSRYWQQTIRYLSRARLGEQAGVELTTDRQSYRRDDSLRLRARFLDDRLAPNDDDGVIVRLDRTGGPQRSVVLNRVDTERGTFAATIRDLSAGAYHAWILAPVVAGAAPSCDFQVADQDQELSTLRAQTAEMEMAARISRGKHYAAKDALQMLDDLPPGRRVRIQALPPQPLWNSWKLALLFVGLLCGEWILRRNQGAGVGGQ
jgi:hypothetical protein